MLRREDREKILHDHKEEYDVEGEEEHEHDDGFDGEEGFVIHVCWLGKGQELLVWVVGWCGRERCC